MYGLDSNTYNIIKSNLSDHLALVNEMDNWLSSVSNFHSSIYEHFGSYPDIINGIILSLNQVIT